MPAPVLVTVVADLGEAVDGLGAVAGTRDGAEPTAGGVTPAAVLVRAAGPDVPVTRGAVLDPDPDPVPVPVPDPDPDPDPFMDVDRPVDRPAGEPGVVGSRDGPLPEHAASSTVTATAAVPRAAVVRPVGGIS